MLPVHPDLAGQKDEPGLCRYPALFSDNIYLPGRNPRSGEYILGWRSSNGKRIPASYCNRGQDLPVFNANSGI